MCRSARSATPNRRCCAKNAASFARTPAPSWTNSPALYEAKGLSAATARNVAEELTDHDPLAAHAEVELGFDPFELTNPWQAALSSALSFRSGRAAAADRNPGRTDCTADPSHRRGGAAGAGGHRRCVGAPGRGAEKPCGTSKFRRRRLGPGDHLPDRSPSRRRDHLISRSVSCARRTSRCRAARVGPRRGDGVEAGDLLGAQSRRRPRRCSPRDARSTACPGSATSFGA